MYSNATSVCVSAVGFQCLCCLCWELLDQPGAFCWGLSSLARCGVFWWFCPAMTLNRALPSQRRQEEDGGYEVCSLPVGQMDANRWGDALGNTWATHISLMTILTVVTSFCAQALVPFSGCLQCSAQQNPALPPLLAQSQHQNVYFGAHRLSCHILMMILV